MMCNFIQLTNPSLKKKNGTVIIILLISSFCFLCCYVVPCIALISIVVNYLFLWLQLFRACIYQIKITCRLFTTPTNLLSWSRRRNQCRTGLITINSNKKEIQIHLEGQPGRYSVDNAPDMCHMVFRIS